MAAKPKSSLASDTLHLPRIYPEAVPVYDSVDSVNNFIILNKALTQLAPFLIIFVVP